MNIVSFDNNSNKIKRDPKQGDLFNLFQKNIMTSANFNFLKKATLPYIVPREFEMRLDRVSEFLYGSGNYVEELMTINDILNPYSIKEGQEIYFCPPSALPNLYTTDELSDEKEVKRQELIKSSQTNKNRSSSSLPVTIKPSNLEQIKVSKDNVVQIINSFE